MALSFRRRCLLLLCLTAIQCGHAAVQVRVTYIILHNNLLIDLQLGQTESEKCDSLSNLKIWANHIWETFINLKKSNPFRYLNAIVH